MRTGRAVNIALVLLTVLLFILSCFFIQYTPVRADSNLTLLWGPYLTGATSNSIFVNARTSAAVIVTVEYAQESDYIATGAYSYKASDREAGLMHHIPITGLMAGTVYHYRLVYAQTVSGDYHWHTFPARGNFTYAIISDTQDELPNFSQYDRFKLVADRIADDPEVDFIIHCGDLVNDGTSLTDWDRFFDSSRNLLADTTLYPALGNHEEGGSLYRQIFGLPSYYSFDCGDAHFTVLDTNDDVDLYKQTEWLIKDLKSRQDWKFVSFHYPLYTSDINHYGGWENFRNAWENIFVQNKVNGVWNGHIHAYECYLEKGINYMVMGTGGGPSVQLSQAKLNGYRNSLENSLAYARVTVDTASGSATVQIIRVADISSNNKEIIKVYPPDTEYEQFVLSGPVAPQSDWDLNFDLVCNGDDLAILESNWGKTGAPGWVRSDVNKDGIINLRDVVLLGLHWKLE
jgi:hypothetical protein